MSSPKSPPELPVASQLVDCLFYLVLACLGFVFFVLTDVGQGIDVATMGISLGGGSLEGELAFYGMLRPAPAVLFAAVAAILGVQAMVHRRWLAVVTATFSVVVVVVVAELLKEVLPRPDFGFGSYAYNTWPSGHTAITTGLAAASLRLLPLSRPRWLKVVLIGASVILIILVALVSVSSHAHRFSDSLCGILIAGSVFALTRDRAQSAKSLWRRRLTGMVAGIALVAVFLIWAADELLSVTSGRLTMIAGLVAAFTAAAILALWPERSQFVHASPGPRMRGTGRSPIAETG